MPDCMTCKHGELSFGKEPCTACMKETELTNRAFSKWEPKEIKQN
ncbi:unnamed protein product [marine sediment metagenome]|uniref:Uncharacterized protein n=1 Tax=marine sediment metagenome TaxID=412755 RepID=X1JRH4_9ZZZZ